MRHPLKLVPPRWWGLLLCVCWCTCLVTALPAIASRHELHARLLDNLDKSYFQRPALEETIHEVQQILNRDPSLPRLTRGEIEELYEKVTREEYHKSLEAGDKARADSMRALMLVLPYNTDNNTEENLQELFTRPPVTKVVDSYSSHQPIQFLTPSMHNEGKSDAAVAIGQMDVTTYKPWFSMKTQPLAPNPTTYHPSNPPSMLYRMTPSVQEGNFIPFKPLVTNLPQGQDYGGGEPSDMAKSGQRFSSHYSAKDTEFLKLALEKRQYTPTSSTIKPVADILESLGIVGQTRNRIGVDDFYAAESAPQPSVVSVADLKGLRSQSLGPQINSDAYAMFKPLNIGEEIRVKPEVEGYLTRFGIVGGRKRKAIKKNVPSSTQNSLEQLSEESEISTSKVPSGHVKPKKSAYSGGGGGTELDKLLENLRELERLNSQSPKAKVTTAKPISTSTTSTTTSTTTTTTTPAPTSTQPALITNGAPLLIEPKKPRRRIDPNIDINFGNQGNQQPEASHSDQLSKLLENLQELEKLKVTPDSALKQAAPAVRAHQAVASRPVAAVTPAPRVEAQTLANRFSQMALTPQQHLQLLQQQFGQGQTGTTQPDLQQLQQVLQQLQAYERVNAKTTKKPTTTTSTTSTTTTTKKPVTLQDQLGPTDLWQLRKILTDDRELEKLFEQAKARQNPRSTTTSTTTTSTTTKRPGPSINELMQLQQYLAQLDRAAARATTTTPKPTTTTTSTTTTTTTTTPKPTTTSTSTTTTTTTTTPSPTTTTTTPAPPPAPPAIPNYSSVDYETRPKKQTVDNSQLQELINRVQQLERRNIPPQPPGLPNPLATDTPLSPFLGFTTRNVKAPAEDIRLPMNDFANLRTLYRQVEAAERVPYGDIEISTKATAAKAYLEQQYDTVTRRTQDFAQRIIDITNDTGSGSSLQQVDANDFVQLQKLLSKVQELQRVRINLPTANPRYKYPKEATPSPAQISGAASQRTQNFHKFNEDYTAHTEILPAPKDSSYQKVQQLLQHNQQEDEDFTLDLPTYRQTIEKPQVAAAAAAAKPYRPQQTQQTSSEELKEIVYAQPYVEPTAYQNLQPPMIHKTVTKEPPRFVATKSTQEIKHETQPKPDLAELQKLLNNAHELKKLGVSLPKELTEKLETKLDQTEEGSRKKETASLEEYNKRFAIVDDVLSEGPVFRAPPLPTTTESPDEEAEPTERTAVFSLTTSKSLTPRPPRTTTESSVEVPIFSATKIIEAAIKRAANKIGVSTEYPQGFRRRSDDNVDDLEMPDDDDMMADFSEFNYQMAMPDPGVINLEREDRKYEPVADFASNTDELQRLIKNLEELQKLNISHESDLLRQADKQYLEALKQTQKPEDDTIKSRRQSAETTETTKEATAETTANPTRVQLNLNLNDDSDTETASSTASSTTSSTTTEEPRNGSLADLEDSFGPDPVTEAPPPPKKKNGFYFLADWNSFLEVGDGDDQVVVRLSPKIGDPRLFLPVKIP